MQDRDPFLATCSATLGWAFGASRRGAQHIEAGTECQDAFAIWSGAFRSRPCIAVAVADGHGDPQYDRSGTGSALAVRAGVDELLSFFRSYGGDATSAQIRAGFRADFPRRVTRRWREYVAGDRVVRGEGAEEDHEYFSGCARYGTTLIAAMVTEDAVFLGQIGDGDIRMVRPSGETIAPFRPDPAMVGKATHSLVARDAHLLWQTATYECEDGAVILLTTDGLPDSFGGEEDEEYATFVASFLERIRSFGVEEIAAQVPAWLDQYSRAGSGDDMTLALVRINPAPGQPGPAPEQESAGDPEQPEDLCPGQPSEEQGNPPEKPGTPGPAGAEPGSDVWEGW